MNQKFDDYLCKKYPKIFRDRYEDMQRTAMCWGFECGDGWFLLIDNLCYCIQKYIDQHNEGVEYCKTHNIKTKEKKVEQVVAVQVKEKLGSLRFYYDGWNDYIRGAVTLAENLSFHTCEICGSTKNIGHTTGWITTICEECKNKEPEKYKTWEKDKTLK